MPEGRRSSSLEAPERKGTEDPGARELESSESDEHFSDAQSVPGSSPGGTSPVPRTRVEKVDGEPSYGEVPGTEAYEMRTNDAAPDEIAIVEDKDNTLQPTSQERPTTPGGHPIPKTVVDESADVPGSATHHYHEDLHKADAAPDMIRKADGNGEVNSDPPSLNTNAQDTDDTAMSPALKSPATHRRRKSSATKSIRSIDENGVEENNDDDDFGDDFDDFEEGDEDADFGDFDEGFQQAETQAEVPPLSSQPQISLPSFPILDLDGLDSEDILAATEPYLDSLYPSDILNLPSLPSPPHDNPIFFIPRSASLWSQLAAPPPLQPPDWIRSRIRRLFLVSLGVPVDLDEILPASKQKKLVLPSLHRVTSNGSLRTSSDSRSVSRLRKSDTNGSSISVDSQGKEKPRSSSKRRKGPPQPPQFDLVSAKQLCGTTTEALSGMTDIELKEHVKKLKQMEATANEVLEFWKKRTDEKIGDREAFEGVIENLVKHARKTRK
ncbi:hypothetical protein F5Y15DRAFT_410917 [Xylariaceae sp. FL0016]|nr:hypothetical protein F5Y15DRAFT_410917 [Xylariaceae sp. FL0016]